MKIRIKVILIYIILLSTQILSQVKVSYVGERIGFEFISSSFTEVIIKKEELDNTKPVASVVFGTMTIKNVGEVRFDVSLSIATGTKTTQIVNFEPNQDKQYRFFAVFTDKLPDKDKFGTEDVLILKNVVATDEIFAVNNESFKVKGFDISSGETRCVFFRLDVSTNIKVSYTTFYLSITVIPSEYNSVLITPSGGEVEIVNRVKLEIPQGALVEEKEIRIVEKQKNMIPKLDGETAVCAYEFSPKGLVFRKPAKLIFNYRYETVNEDKLCIYYWDGYEWRYIGGKVDKQSKTVSTYISHFSIYALIPVIYTPTYKPKEKIITPATKDGINDVATFDGLSGKDVNINIFDITGRRVKTISVLEKGNIWDGTDEYGNIVESGVYVYQFELDGKIYSGSITVAK
ncbi:MAG: gliding motility-associated C-terminal domain-containing protein [Endomicrobia bacterium]|nr:gliding motility-associated C-terminal domain-containing protein [Endomicrobiia bacterium]